MALKPYDRDALKQAFNSAEPFRHIAIEQFLEPDFAQEVAAAYPSFAEAEAQGFGFNFVNERKKIQVSDSTKFPEPVARLHNVLQSPKFLADLEYITGMPTLVNDPALAGGGMHLTGPHGRLDVHVDFNYSEDTQAHRRLNILVYLNPEWEEEWGGAVELWDRDVTKCHHSFLPKQNRMVLFETSQISFHGVTPLTCPPDKVRQSFAAYYYTREAPDNWDGSRHDTIFRARPDEKMSKYFQMPAERVQRGLQRGVRNAKKAIKGLIGR
ncbi:MAG: Rps23 Pro-64 3,4-dihydroxylase Tpa1-like proline 4-hydroxylase [Myxococcota bacterium]|jgi:Rps23 Pro-64 3,4-dihydroxylase Tpa1-like proline 4-hydroxylase